MIEFLYDNLKEIQELPHPMEYAMFISVCQYIDGRVGRYTGPPIKGFYIHSKYRVNINVWPKYQKRRPKYGIR